MSFFLITDKIRLDQIRSDSRGWIEFSPESFETSRKFPDFSTDDRPIIYYLWGLLRR